MSIPDDDKIKRALLGLLSKAPDGTMHCQEVYRRLARDYPELTEDEVKVRYVNSESKWANRVQFARQHCVEDGHILNANNGPGRGYWRITDQGRAAVEEWGNQATTNSGGLKGRSVMADSEGMRNLEKHLQSLLPSLHGDWVDGKKKYDRAFAEAIGAEYEDGRQWDCVWNGMHIECKFGSHGHIWFPLVRYAEVVLETTEEARVPVTTLCVRYRENRITDLYALDHGDLIEALNLSERSASDILRIQKEAPRDLNAQSRLAFTDLRCFAQFHVAAPPGPPRS